MNNIGKMLLEDALEKGDRDRRIGDKQTSLSGKQLGLRASSVRDYQFDKVTRIPGSPQIPESDVRALRGSIFINLKTGCNCDSIAYDSLLPLSFLRVSHLNHNAVF